MAANIKPIEVQQLENFLINGQAGFYRLAYSYLKNQDEALDAVQSAVCRALERRASLKDKDALRPWFNRILINICLDMLRQSKRLTPTPYEQLEQASYEDPLPADGLLTQRIDGLPMEMQTIIKLRFFEDLTLNEISTVTGLNISTVKTRLYSALKKLRLSLEGVKIE